MPEPDHPPPANPTTQAKQYYRALKPELDTVAHDPLDPPKRYHDGIFIETDPATGLGTLFNVTGDIIAASGMRYEVKESWTPGQDGPVHRITQLGWVRRADFDSGAVGEVLRGLPKPTRQQGINFWEVDAGTGRHELVWTKESGELYGPGEKKRAVFKCNEWTAEYAIPALRSSGILVSTTGS